MNHDISMNVRGDSFVCGVCLRGSHVVLTLFFLCGLVRGHQIPDVQLCLDVLGDSLSFSKLCPACVEWKVKAESVSYNLGSHCQTNVSILRGIGFLDLVYF